MKVRHDVDSAPEGEYAALVVSLEELGGRWQIVVEGTGGRTSLPLTPATFVIRFWRSRDGRLLRGTIALRGSDTSAPFQSNAQIEQLMRSWLYDGNAGGKR